MLVKQGAQNPKEGCVYQSCVFPLRFAVVSSFLAVASSFLTQFFIFSISSQMSSFSLYRQSNPLNNDIFTCSR